MIDAFEFVRGAEAEHVKCQVDKCQLDAQFAQFVKDLRLRRRRSGAVLASQCVATLRRLIAAAKFTSTVQLLSFVMAVGRVLIAANRSQLLVYTMVRRVLGIIRKQHMHLMHKRGQQREAPASSTTSISLLKRMPTAANMLSPRTINSTTTHSGASPELSGDLAGVDIASTATATTASTKRTWHHPSTVKLENLLSSGKYFLGESSTAAYNFASTPNNHNPTVSPSAAAAAAVGSACVKDASEGSLKPSTNCVQVHGANIYGLERFNIVGIDLHDEPPHSAGVDWGYTDNTFFDDLKHQVFESLEDLISDIRSEWQAPWHLIRDLFSDISRILIFGESNSVQRTLRSIRQQHAKRKSALELIFAGSGETTQSAEIAIALANEGFQVFYVELAAVRVLAAKCDAAIVGAVSILCNGDAVAASGALIIAEAMKAFGKPLLMVASVFRICPLSLFGRFSMNETCPFRIPPSADRLGSFGCPSRAERVSIPVPVSFAGTTEGLISGVVQFDWIESRLISSYITNTGCLDPSAVMLYVNKWYAAEDSSLSDEYSLQDLNRAMLSVDAMC